MDVELHNEVLIQDIYAFVGTVGGSLGLFIGFSYRYWLCWAITGLFDEKLLKPF